MGNSSSKKTIPLPIHSVFNFPSALPSWPPGGGFASGEIDLGGLTVAEVKSFTKVWTTNEGGPNDSGATFFEPTGLPEGFSTLGYYAQPNNRALFGSVLVGKDTSDPSNPTLAQPTDYTLVWASKSSSGYIWAPVPPNGFSYVGLVVTTKPDKPRLDKVRCVRSDLTAIAEPDELIWNANEFNIYETRPNTRGEQASAMSVGTFMARSNNGTINDIACLKNVSTNAFYMPNLDQIHALIKTYSPKIYLHPDEEFFPSSVDWFFSNGALLYKKDDESNPVPVDPNGPNLPQGGSNDGMYWLDFPRDTKARERVKKGDIESACAYFHVKPIFGGTYCDLAIWQFYPFNGGAKAKVGLANVSLGKIGEHVGDWEHVTMRVSNFNGILKKAYFSQHSGGVWVNASNLEYFQDGTNHFVGYASLSGHANYPHPGVVLQGNGSSIGLRNDSSKSDKVWDTGNSYKIVSGDYLGAGVVVEPPWLNFTREWGPKIRYDIASKVDKASKILPGKLSLPNEVSGEEGPTGPKMKDNWYQDEK